MPEMIGHVLVSAADGGAAGGTTGSSISSSSSGGGGGEERLVLASAATLGRAYGHALLEDAAGAELFYVASTYDPTAPAPTPASTRRWAAFLDSAGVNASIAFQPIAAGAPTAADINALHGGKMPQLRSSNKTVPLPYGLGGVLRSLSLSPPLSLAACVRQLALHAYG
jgi:hypothetical protein